MEMGRIPQLTLREVLPKAFRYCCCFFYQLASNSDLELSLNTYGTTWFPIKLLQIDSTSNT